MIPLPSFGQAVGKPDTTAPRTLIDELLAEQGRFTAVEEFARGHSGREITGSRYRALLPAAAPAPGQQYAFEVNLDQCSGCKACVTACHSLNGLDDDETWRSVGRLASTDWREPLQQVVTTACHHCVDPGCLNGCPVLAYDKDPITGIVRHLDDQCIGCQYCVMKCPYEVPQYSKARGIVRKCDMCSARLAVGEAPACVQACPNEAIRITVVEQAKVRGKYRNVPVLSGVSRGESGKVGKCASSPAHFPTFSPANLFLPDSPNPAITLPTTRYVSQRALPADLAATDAHEVRRAPAHPPLTLMLVLSQLGAGLALMNALTGGLARLLGIVALAITLLGVVAGTLHLGQPLKAWRSFLGWRTSWLSRELIAFGVFLGVLGALVVLQHLSRESHAPFPLTPTLSPGERESRSQSVVEARRVEPSSGVKSTEGRATIPPLPGGEGRGEGETWLQSFSARLILPTSILAALTGLMAVACSAMLYVDTRRPFWNAPMTFGKFFGSTLLLGGAGALVVSVVIPDPLAARGVAVALVVLGTAFKLAVENRIFRFLVDDQDPHLTALNKTALLLNGPFGLLTRGRTACALAGGVVLPPLLLITDAGVGLASLALALSFGGELIERHLFFVAEVAPKMPGGRGV